MVQYVLVQYYSIVVCGIGAQESGGGLVLRQRQLMASITPTLA